MLRIYPQMSEELKDKADTLADGIASNVGFWMREKYPEPMRWASGGFRKTLHANVKRYAKEVILDLLSKPSN